MLNGTFSALLTRVCLPVLSPALQGKEAKYPPVVDLWEWAPCGGEWATPVLPLGLLGPRVLSFGDPVPYAYAVSRMTSRHSYGVLHTSWHSSRASVSCSDILSGWLA